MTRSLAHKLIDTHLVGGEPSAGQEVAIQVDQILVDDSVGPLIALELEAMGVEQVDVPLAVGYVDHLLLQEDQKNPDDHEMMRSACQRYGMWYSRAGNGICHPVHMARFGVPGGMLLGSDSHTCAAGAIGMLAIGSGGLTVALAMAGEPLYLTMPEVLGVRLAGRMSDWVSAKDVILEMLRRHGVAGATGRIIEYYGPGLDSLTVWDRYVIAHMGAELGATTSVFPSDAETKRFLTQQGRGAVWEPLTSEEAAVYDADDEIDLSTVEPLIALSPSPGNVVPVSQIAGTEISQAYIGSSGNPSYRDFAIAAHMVAGRQVDQRVSFDVNPASREILENLVANGHIMSLLHSGARLHQAGCNGCPGMGQAPASGKVSLRTVPRNFPGRSGTADDIVHLVSPETAAASALAGVVTDPRSIGAAAPVIPEPETWIINIDMLKPPLPPDEAQRVSLVKSANHVEIPEFPELPDELTLPVLLKMADDVSTDEILPAGGRVMPYWANVAKVSEFAFEGVDQTYPSRAAAAGGEGHAVVAGANYGQGSSRELAALAPRYLGLRVVLAKSYARIHWDNLVAFGILPLRFTDPSAYDLVGQGSSVTLGAVHQLLRQGTGEATDTATAVSFAIAHDLSKRQADIVRQGGAINVQKARRLSR